MSQAILMVVLSLLFITIIIPTLLLVDKYCHWLVPPLLPIIPTILKVFFFLTEWLQFLLNVLAHKGQSQNTSRISAYDLCLGLFIYGLLAVYLSIYNLFSINLSTI